MRLKFTDIIMGEQVSYGIGEEVELPKAVALAYVNAGLAELVAVKPEDKLETRVENKPRGGRTRKAT